MIGANRVRIDKMKAGLEAMIFIGVDDSILYFAQQGAYSSLLDDIRWLGEAAADGDYTPSQRQEFVECKQELDRFQEWYHRNWMPLHKKNRTWLAE